MSAFMCGNKHFNAMLAYLFGNKDTITYYDGQNPGVQLTKLEAVQILRDENVRSLRCRYGESAKQFHVDEPAVMRVERLQPVDVLKACACYDYQACESDDHQTTKAAVLTNNCRKAAISALPGYEAADWEIM